MKIPFLFLLLFASAIAWFYQKTRVPTYADDATPPAQRRERTRRKPERLEKILQEGELKVPQNEPTLNEAFAQASVALNRESSAENYSALPSGLANELNNPERSPETLGQAFIQNSGEIQATDFAGRLGYLEALRQHAEIPKSLTFIAALRQLEIPSHEDNLREEEKEVLKQSAELVSQAASTPADLARLYSDILPNHPSEEAQEIIRSIFQARHQKVVEEPTSR